MAQGMIASTRLLPRRRRQIAWVLALIGAPAQAAAMVPFRSDLHLSSVLLLFVPQAVAAAAVGGAGPALVAALLGFMLANWYFTPPLHTWTIAEQESFTALFVYLVVAGVVAWLVTIVARRSADAARARAGPRRWPGPTRCGRAPQRRLPRPAHAAGQHQGLRTSLLAGDVDWPPEDARSSWRTIERRPTASPRWSGTCST